MPLRSWSQAAMAHKAPGWWWVCTSGRCWTGHVFGKESRGHNQMKGMEMARLMCVICLGVRQQRWGVLRTKGASFKWLISNCAREREMFCDRRERLRARRWVCVWGGALVGLFWWNESCRNANWATTVCTTQTRHLKRRPDGKEGVHFVIRDQFWRGLI